MYTWNREELYGEVWKTPLSKLAAKYGISDVRLGKVCRELSIPVPGLGYWARKAAGQRLEKPPLPKLAKVPLVVRLKQPSEDVETLRTAPPPEPTDDYYRKVLKTENRSFHFGDIQTRHRLVAQAEKKLAKVRVNGDGVVEAHLLQLLDIRVSRDQLERALGLMNALITLLEAEGFPVTLQTDPYATTVVIFGQPVHFAVTEKLQNLGKREVKNAWGGVSTVTDRRPTGMLELRMDNFSYGPRLRDNRRDGKLEERLGECLGRMMRIAREDVLRTERFRREEEKRRRREQERQELEQAIREEQDKVEELECWTAAWVQAQNMRDFINAYEARLIASGANVGPGTVDGNRLVWMREQADRLDPLAESPASVLDQLQLLRRR